MRLMPQMTKSTKPGSARAWLVHTRLGRVTSDRKVHGETRRAAESASRAARRVRRVGVTRALSDRRVAREVRRSTKHASRAADLALHPRRSHRGRNAAIVAAGALVGGTAYAGYRSASSRSGSEQAEARATE